jgi:hypothetical protein
MNSILHIPSTINVLAGKSKSGAIIPDTYRLEVTYKPQCPPLIYNAVFIPPKLAEALRSDQVDAFNIIGLRFASRGAWVLPNYPQHIVIGVRLRNGEVVVEVPRVWKGLWWRGTLIGASLILISALVGIFAHAAVIAIACSFLSAAGTCRLMRAKELEINPFRVISIWSR